MSEENGNSNGKHNGNSNGKHNGTHHGSSNGLFKRARHRAMEYGLAQALTILGKTSETNYEKIAGVLERAAGNDENKRMVAGWIRTWLSPGHPGARWLKHLLTDVHPNVRQRFWARLVASVIYRGAPPICRLPDGREFQAPVSMVISPTMRCNLRCVGCYAGNYTQKDDLTEEEVVRVISEAREMGMRFFVFSGGEPLIYKPLFDIFRRFDDCFFQIYTSGPMVTPELAKRIVELGNVVPAVSIEGFKEETEARRGPGGYERVMRAMDILRDAGACFAFSVTATRRNFAAITSDAFAQLMVDKGAVYGFYFSYIPIGRSPDLELMPTPEERNRLRMFVNHFRNDYPMLVADFWNDGALTNGCLSGGRNYVHINNHGDVEACVFAHFAVDNIRQKPLKECLASDFFTAFRKAAPYGRNLLRPCPIIDRPQVLRGLVKKYGAYATHDGGESILTESAAFLDQYSDGLAKIYDEVWAKEYRWAAKFHGIPEYDFCRDCGEAKAGPAEEDADTRVPVEARS